MALNSNPEHRPHRSSGALGWIIGLAAAVLVVLAIAAIWGGDDEVETAGMMDPNTETTVGAAGERVDPTMDTQPGEMNTGAMDTDVQPETATGVTPGAPADAIVIDENANLEENPSAFTGKTVTVQGEANEVLSPGLYRVDSDGLVGSDEVTVYAPTATFNQGDKVQVVGTVRLMDYAVFESEYGLTVDREMFAQSEPVIVATTATVVEQE